MPNTILPCRLQTGDSVALITPAFIASEDQIRQAVTRLEALGLKVINMAVNQQNDGYFASSAPEMVAKLHAAFSDSTIKAIISARGGYGCARLLPFLDWDLIAANPKIVLGFSDVTALLIAIQQQTGIVTFHGPSASMPWPQSTLDSLQEILFTGVAARYPHSAETKILRKGSATGELIGGNLSVLASLIGSPYVPIDWRNKILFLEDVHEEVYRLDRMLMQLKLANILPNLKGLIFGRFNECPTRVTNSFTIMQLQERITQDLNIPVLTNVMFGHQPEMFTFPIGITALLDANEGYIKLLNSAVK